MFGRGGFDPSKIQKMMKQMGIKTKELEGVKEVTIELSDKTLVFKEPDVQFTKMKGQETYQVMGKPEEREVGPEISDEDVKMVMEQANVDEETATKALMESDGDIAQAIVDLE